jgi:beta-phosphoglucomutase-like phosphatase (HAD superfamily)
MNGEKMCFKAVIFDLDGTLVEASSAWRTGFQKILASLNHHMTEDDFQKLYRMTYMEIRCFFRDIYEAKKQTGHISFDSVMNNLTSEMERRYSFEIQAKPHALHFVKTLYNLEIPACLATLTPINIAEKALTWLGFTPYLDFVITGDDVGASKKFADIYLTAAKRLGFQPCEIIVFEDCPTAAKTAYNAGFIVCGVADPSQSRQIEELYPYCHWYITGYRDAFWKVPAMLAGPAWGERPRLLTSPSGGHPEALFKTQQAPAPPSI